ncbi:MAG TPA: hypothetical protein PKA58_19855 [Polyangium sp.]|nr:hypothetical protein [Polyangium sp.]
MKIDTVNALQRFQVPNPLDGKSNMTVTQSHHLKYHCQPPDRLTIEIGGELGDHITEELTTRTVEALTKQPSIRFVVVDLRTLRDCRVMARVGLTTLQKLLLRRQLRTAWIVATPRFHGLAMLAIGGAGDPNASVFSRMEQVDAWFVVTDSRVQHQLSRFARTS